MTEFHMNPFSSTFSLLIHEFYNIADWQPTTGAYLRDQSIDDKLVLAYAGTSAGVPMSVKARLARLDANQPPEPFKPWATFLWASEADNAALERAEQAAQAEGRNIMVIRLVSPELDGNGRAIRRQAQ